MYIASNRRRFDIPPTPYSPASHSPYTLPSSVSRKPCICHSYENSPGVGVFFPFWKSLCGHCDKNSLLFKCFLFRFLRTLLHRQKLNSFVFKRFRTLCTKTPGGGVSPPLPGKQNASKAAHLDYLLMSSFASRRLSNGWRKGLVASGAPLMACVISLAAVGKSPEFDEIRASARWLTQ